MGITSSFFQNKNPNIPKIETIMQYTQTKEENKQPPVDNLESQNNYELQNEKMSSSDYMVAFSGLTKSYCIGLVDMADSTKISANMNEKEWCRYYEIFLNSIANILPKFGAL